MILSHLAAVTLLVNVAASSPSDSLAERLSLHQKDVVARAHTRVATECIIREVAADKRFQADNAASNLGDLIVEAVPRCLGPVRAMVDAYDRYFGDGAGERFLMGTYLDTLPNAVMNAIGTVPTSHPVPANVKQPATSEHRD